MLRRQYPEVGKRGIGVGYPAGMHLVFDAGQMRLASLWRGEFVETSGVWRGQGSGNVRPLSRRVFHLPKGPAFALLRQTGQGWPQSDAKKAEGFQFKGYDLDEQRRPTFRYAMGRVEIEDRFIDERDEAGDPALVRTLRFSRQPTSLFMRLAVGDAIEFQKGAYTVDGRLKITPSVKGAIKRTAENQPQLLLPIKEEVVTLRYELLGEND